VAAGHQVELFAPGDSTCPVLNRSSLPQALGNIGSFANQRQYARAGYESLHGCDVISDHTLGIRHLPKNHPPAVVTMHGPPIGMFRQMYQSISGAASLVAISKSQRRSAGPIRIAATIPHGVDLQDYPLKTDTGDYSLFLGRFHPEKAPHVAIEVAQRFGTRLLLAGKVEDPAEKSYFNLHIRPLLNKRIEFIGEIGGNERLEMLQGAKALIAPNWGNEPFGLATLEAIACGTPAITFPFGGSLEVVQNGINGYICSTAAEMAERLSQVDTIDPLECRKSIASTYDSAQMARNYIGLFNKVISTDFLAEVPGGNI
jgi:glycosyltransferase involved in cell wall biosynthesis